MISRVSALVEVFCDGSISPSTFEGPHVSRLAGHVGRAMVVIPTYDSGLIARFGGNLTLPNGHENALYAEVMAIKQADQFCKEKAIKPSVIYSDNGNAIQVAGLPGVEPLPYSRLNLANEYLRSILRYAGYSRNSKVKRRTEISEKRLEVLRMMNADRLEFKLSESRLYRTYQAKAKRTGRLI